MLGPEKLRSISICTMDFRDTVNLLDTGTRRLRAMHKWHTWSARQVKLGSSLSGRGCMSNKVGSNRLIFKGTS